MEREAQGLKRTTEALEGRTAALSEQLAAQRSQADQRLFAAQQETDQAHPFCIPFQDKEGSLGVLLTGITLSKWVPRFVQLLLGFVVSACSCTKLHPQTTRE